MLPWVFIHETLIVICGWDRSSRMIEVVLNDRLGKKVRVKCNEDDTIGDLKKLVAAQTGTRADKIRIQKWYTIYKDRITLKDYEIHDGMGLELYYNWTLIICTFSSCAPSFSVKIFCFDESYNYARTVKRQCCTINL